MPNWSGLQEGSTEEEIRGRVESGRAKAEKEGEAMKDRTERFSEEMDAEVRARAESARSPELLEDGLLPPDGFQQTAAMLIGAVAMQKFSPDRGADVALSSLVELKALASVWLQSWIDMDLTVRKKVDGARVLLSEACRWLEDCDWTLCRTKEGRKRLREARETGGDPAPPAPPAPERAADGKDKYGKDVD